MVRCVRAAVPRAAKLHSEVSSVEKGRASAAANAATEFLCVVNQLCGSRQASAGGVAKPNQADDVAVRPRSADELSLATLLHEEVGFELAAQLPSPNRLLADEARQRRQRQRVWEARHGS